VSTSEVDTWRTVSFWTEKLTEVLIWSFPKIDVLSVMRIKTQGLKNKVVKTQGLKRCLTLVLMTMENNSKWQNSRCHPLEDKSSKCPKDNPNNLEALYL
jgi:hypothetical protein